MTASRDDLMTANMTIRIQEADFDIAREIAALTKGRTDIGAVVSFSGICRGSEGDEPIAALTLEHYPGMAEAEIARHAETAMSRWPLTGLSVIHRVGRIVPGENIVLVLTASQHRQAAFQAAEFLRGFLKGSARKSRREPVGSMRTIAMMQRRRAGPSPDGEAYQTGREARSRDIEIPQNRLRRVADAARFRPLCGEPFRRSQTGVRARHHRSRGRGRIP